MYVKIKGFKYYTFGLRQEWLYSFIGKGKQFLKDNSLGPRQIEAFIYYLKDCKIIDKEKNPSPLFNILRSIYLKDGAISQTFWGIVWINLCFNSSLFTWWTTLPIGNYNRKYLIDKLILSYGKENRYLKNGFCSIKETLSKSPIGEILGQGVAIKKGKIIEGLFKTGLNKIHSILILYNLYKLAEKENRYEINLLSLEDELFSPQKIFAISTRDLEKSLFESLEYETFYKLPLEKRRLIFLNKSLIPIGLLENYIGG
jgi:hypothetical protein